MAIFFKVVVLGDGGIGKTSICNYLTTGEFFGSYKLSIGADFFSKKLLVNGEDVTLQICDIGGQDQFAEISNIFTKGAHGAILCYDSTRRDTLDSLDRWLKKLDDSSIPKVLVSTKNDIDDMKEVLDDEGVHTAQQFKIPYYIPTTSLKGLGISETFHAISKLMLMHKKGLDLPQKSEMIDITQPQEPQIFHITASQHTSAQPLGIGRVPTAFDDEEASIQPPTTTKAPMVYAPSVIPPTADTEEEEEVKPSFIKPISLTPPITPSEKQHEYERKPFITSPQEFSHIEPPTEPEKTATQPIRAITPPIPEQHLKEPQIEEKEEKTFEPLRKSNFSFLDRLREERRRLAKEENKE